MGVGDGGGGWRRKEDGDVIMAANDPPKAHICVGSLVSRKCRDKMQTRTSRITILDFQIPHSQCNIDP